MCAEDAARRSSAEQIVRDAWQDLPDHDRRLLETIGAAQWSVVAERLGGVVSDLLQSAGYERPNAPAVEDLEMAVGVWIAQLRLVVINADHPALADLDAATYEAIVARAAWHEWAHALSVVRATGEDVAAGERLLELAPAGIRDFIRRGSYRRREYTHELVAEIYALLMSRRRRGQVGRPAWLHDEIYEMVRRVSGWNE